MTHLFTLSKMTQTEILQLIYRQNEELKEQKEELKEQKEDLKDLSKKIDKSLTEVKNIARQHGIIVESLVNEGAALELQNEHTGNFLKIYENIPLRFGKQRGEIDRIFIYEKVIILVDIKSKYHHKDLEEFTDRIIPLVLKDAEARRLIGNKLVFGVVAGLQIAYNVIKPANKNGLYVMKVLNENIRIANAKNFQPKNLAA